MVRRLFLGLIGRTATQELQPDAVDRLVDGYERSEPTKQLVDFGLALIRANDQRVSAIDAKATSLAGYSTAILALLVTRDDLQWSTIPPLQAFLMFCAGLLAVMACGASFNTLRAARNWQTIGEATWFANSNVIGDADKLGRWYVKAMHQSLQANHRTTNAKAEELIVAQLSVAVAGVLLGLGYVVGILSRLFG